MHERLLVTMMTMTLCFGDDIVSLVMMRMLMLIVMLLLLLLTMPIDPNRGIQTKAFNVWGRLWAMMRLIMLPTSCLLLLRWERERLQTKDFDIWFQLWARMLMMLPPSSFITFPFVLASQAFVHPPGTQVFSARLAVPGGSHFLSRIYFLSNTRRSVLCCVLLHGVRCSKVFRVSSVVSSVI